MPYIQEKIRIRLRPIEVAIDNNPCCTAGELNYIITLLIKKYFKSWGLCYQICNDIVGALDNCKGEFKRRVQDPYENLKIQENGDVY